MKEPNNPHCQQQQKHDNGETKQQQEEKKSLLRSKKKIKAQQHFSVASIIYLSSQ